MSALTKPRHALAASRRLAVITTKDNGTQVVFGTYRTREEADAVVAQLARIGSTARVEPALATDYSGRTRTP